MLNPFWLALQTLTRVPVPPGSRSNARNQGRAVLYFPLVGVFIGCMLVVTYLLLQGQDENLLAIIILILWVSITGALHLDGLADSADGWLGGHGDRERILEIMQDSHSGVAAIVSIVLVLFLKFIAIRYLLTQETILPALLLTPALARMSVIPLYLTTPYARPGGMGEQMARNLPRIAGWSATTIVILVCIVLYQWRAFSVIFMLIFFGLMLRWLMMKNIGGVTGDTTGAFIEIMEAVALLGLAFKLPGYI